MKPTILRTTLPFVALAATAGFATVAQAHVIEWHYTFTSTFSAAVFEGAGFSDTSVGPQRISWSDDDGDTSAIGAAPLDPTLYAPAEGSVFTNGPVAPVDTYYHENNILDAGTDSLLSATLTVNIELQAVDPAGDPLAPPLTRSFEIDFFETPNHPAGGGCADGGTDGDGINSAGCADIFVIAFDPGAFEFEYDIGDGSGLQDYTLFFFEDPLDVPPKLGVLSDEACTFVGADLGCFGFLTAEDATTFADFVISIEHLDIPEPAMLGLFGLGLIGLGAARRRKA